MRFPTQPDATTFDAAGLLGQAYCLTLVRGVGVDQTLARLGADLSASTTSSFCELVGSAYEDGDGGLDRQLVGAAPLDGWTLVLEPNGYACTGKKRIRKLSRRTTTVTLYRHLDAAQELSINADGKRLQTLDLIPRPADTEDGAGWFDLAISTTGARASTPTADALAAVGSAERASGAVLVEHFTGVRLTVALLGRLRYQTGTLDNR